ncbi:MAG TPA: transcription antitermination factor NusB, partial [Acidimicrobiia bacterium]|nr:transcription antitermination factor NusB [Acidimicrobiia bacterium]
MTDATVKEHVTARVVALDALVRVEDGAYAHVVLPAMLAQTHLSDRDRAFATDLVYGTVRSQRRLDDLLAHVVKRPIPRLDPPVRAALRLGAYQLLHDTPPHAAVASTVDAVGARSPRARGFVNANLRGLTRLPKPWPEPTDDAVALSYPDWLVERLTRDLGRAAAREALVAMNAPAAVTLRPDPRQVTVTALAEELEAAGAEVQTGRLVGDALIVRGVGDPGGLDAVRDGRATPQDQGSQAVVNVLAPAPGERIADVAAAPGGKATAIAEKVGADGGVVALDVDAGRVRMIDGARHRIGLPHLLPIVADARAAPLRVRLRRSAANEPPRRRVVALGVARPAQAATSGRLRRELERSRHDVDVRLVAGAPGAGKWANLNAALRERPATGADW